MQSIITKNEKETKKVAADLAKKLIQQRFRNESQAIRRNSRFYRGSSTKSGLRRVKKSGEALILALQGELGAGKTTFIKGFSKALKIIEKVLSPTFVLIHRHHLKSGNLYHIDAYRLKSEKDLLKLNIKEIFNNPKNIVLIEWADRVKKVIPKSAIWIYFEHLDKNPEVKPSVPMESRILDKVGTLYEAGKRKITIIER